MNDFQGGVHWAAVALPEFTSVAASYRMVLIAFNESELL